eukprot:jgi/Ulvmu1/8459/UM043_0039.1
MVRQPLSAHASQRQIIGFGTGRIRTACRRFAAGVVKAEASPRTSVLFVCLGNICRSPTAEAVFNDVVSKAGVAQEFSIDSCGTGGGNPEWYKDGGWSYHEGEDADPRMTKAASARGVKLTSKSRPLRPADLEEFDYIVGMDPKNILAMKVASEHWKATGKAVPDEYEHKFLSMAAFCSKHSVESVPDPYYGGPQGFDNVLDLLDDACTGLLSHIQSESK